MVTGPLVSQWAHAAGFPSASANLRIQGTTGPPTPSRDPDSNRGCDRPDIDRLRADPGPCQAETVAAGSSAG